MALLRGFFGRDRDIEKDRERTGHALESTRRGWFGQVATLFRRSGIDDELWDELEETLILGDVGVATTQKILERLRERIRQEGVSDPSDALELLKREVGSLMETDGAGAQVDVDVAEPPLALLVVGVNGVGKTTSIAKLAHAFREEGRSVLLGAADTFRAAAIDQLQAWGERLDIDVVAHRPGADPASVAFDALSAARARGMDVAIIDTAGRLHTKTNLMQELRKIQRALSRQIAPESQRVLLTLDATTGQNGLYQARAFVDAVKCDGVFLAKLDGTAKGGVAIAIADELGLPVLYVGTGERPEDVAAFDARAFVDGLFGE